MCMNAPGTETPIAGQGKKEAYKAKILSTFIGRIFALEKVSRFDRISRRGVHLPLRGGHFDLGGAISLTEKSTR